MAKNPVFRQNSPLLDKTAVCFLQKNGKKTRLLCQIRAIVKISQKFPKMYCNSYQNMVKYKQAERKA